MTWERFWEDVVGKEWYSSFPFMDYCKIISFLDGKTFCPKRENVFKVFNTPPSKIKVVILGQDPYHDKDRATGLKLINEYL